MITHGVLLDKESLDNRDLDFASLQASLPEWHMHDHTSATEVAERIREAEVVVSNKVMLDAASLDNAPALKLICVAATGTNNVDLEAARRRDITVCNVTGYATPSVVEHVFALILALQRKLRDWQGSIEAQRWQQATQFCLLDHPMTELSGRSMGIVGYGELGKAVAHVARAFGMQVLIAARPGSPAGGERLPLAELLPQVDVLSLHCPLTDSTRNLIDASALALMKPSALLINTARGGIVDETALAQALRQHRLGGAGIDVLSVEPPVNGNVLLETDIPNLVVTPHVAWASREARQRLIDEVAENIREWSAGRTRNRVV